jgi:(p)ppGpp synthase/HD superfamily hydrolase
MSETTDQPRLGNRFAAALAFAATLHRSQTRKAKTTPYIAHLLAVSSLALDNGADEDEAIAALLHDAVEDQGGEPTRVRIEGLFGRRVSDLVMALSDSTADTREGGEKLPWRKRKESYLAHLRESDESTRLLSACDKLHNLRELIEDLDREGPGFWDRFNAGPREQLWFFRSFVDAVGTDPSRPVFAQLAHAVARLEAVVDAASGDD